MNRLRNAELVAGALLLVGLVTACGTAQKRALIEDLELENWIEVRAEHATILTNAGEATGRRLALQLERFIDSFRRLVFRAIFRRGSSFFAT